MTRLRRAITLAFCALLSLPLGASALGFHEDSEEYEFERHHESDDGTASWREDIVLDTGTDSEDHDGSNLTSLVARHGDGSDPIHELIFGHQENDMEHPERHHERRDSEHFNFFREIQNQHPDDHDSRSGRFEHHGDEHDHGHRHSRHDTWAGMHDDQHHDGTSNIPPVPEPTTALLIGIGLVGLAVQRRRHEA